MSVFDHAWCATKGAREYQEDMAAVQPGKGKLFRAEGAERENGSTTTGSPDHVIAVLADGMGGHTGGALASRMACESFVKSFTAQHGSVRDRLRDALDHSNNALAEKVESDPVLSGMGCTLVGAVVGVGGVEWVSVGDSPLYLYRNGEIALLNEDHSLAPELDRLAASGQITYEQARVDPRRHMLRSAVTGEELDLIDQSMKPLELLPGDYVILASDGLQTLENSEIERIVSAYAKDGADAVAAALIRSVEALRDPHQDNATVVVVRAFENKTA